MNAEPGHIGYVVKRFPRYSETFVVNEMLAHEAAGVPITIFSLYAPNDTHFQDAIAHLRAPVRYLTADGLKAAEFWDAMRQTGALIPQVWPTLPEAEGAEAREVYQALLLAREVRRTGISHLHAHFASTATTVAMLAARFSGVPFTFTAHAKDIFHESVRPDDLRRKLALAAAVVTVSDFNVRYLRETFGASALRIERIYNGVPLHQFSYEPPRHRSVRIVAVGRLVEKKGFRYLIDACAQLAARGSAATCEIIGTGPLEADLRAQVSRLQLDDRVRLMGPQPRSAVVQALRGAAVCVAPCIIGSDSDRDGLPTILLEAMAVGTPCVATDVTGIPEVIHQGETGLLVPQANPSALADAIDRLLADEHLRVSLATRARQLIERQFDIHTNAARLRDVFVGCHDATTRDPSLQVA